MPGPAQRRAVHRLPVCRPCRPDSGWSRYLKATFGGMQVVEARRPEDARRCDSEQASRWAWARLVLFRL